VGGSKLGPNRKRTASLSHQLIVKRVTTICSTKSFLQARKPWGETEMKRRLGVLVGGGLLQYNGVKRPTGKNHRSLGTRPTQRRCTPLQTPEKPPPTFTGTSPTALVKKSPPHCRPVLSTKLKAPPPALFSVLNPKRKKKLH